jgi:hypothetical protein
MWRPSRKLQCQLVEVDTIALLECLLADPVLLEVMVTAKTDCPPV